MKRSEILKLIENIEDDINLVDIKEFKSWLDGEKDKHSSKAITTALENFKNKDMQKLIDDEIAKRHPDKTPEQLKIEELEQKIMTQESRAQRAEMISKFKDTLVEKNIPSKMMDFLLGENDDDTTNNINSFEEAMKIYVDNQVETRLGESSYTPPSGNPPAGNSTNFIDIIKENQVKRD